MMGKVFKVSEFNQFISVYLEQVGEVVVEGEISEVKLSQGKWVFLTIKDQEASLPVFSILYKINNFSSLSEGMLVKVYGSVRLHQKTAGFSLMADQIVPSGEGALKIAYERLKQKLSLEGLFAQERKRQITRFPSKIALLTAKNSQAYADFVKVFSQRMGGVEINFYPLAVQGVEAVASILSTFDDLERRFTSLDAVVLVRGGGSLEDLQAFNEETVVRRIFSSRFPVVTGVGHENDWTLVDFVSDLRASTPSNAAELMTYSRTELLYKLTSLTHEIENIIKTDLAKKQRLISSFASLLAIYYRSYEDRLEALTRMLSNLDYQRTLRRGFSITLDQHGRIITGVKGTIEGDEIATQLFKGQILSKVISSKDEK